MKRRQRLTESPHASERAFAALMAASGVPLVYPAPRLSLPSLGTTYRPDFASPTEAVFYEVVGTSGAYRQNQRKYAALRHDHPSITLRLVTPDGHPYVSPDDVVMTKEGHRQMSARGGRRAWEGISPEARAIILQTRWASRRVAESYQRLIGTA